jgi:amino acid adenylation domain-containing protein
MTDLRARLKALSPSQRQELFLSLWQSEPSLVQSVLKTSNFESLAAFYSASGELSASSLREFLVESLPSVAVPSSLYKIDEFPTTAHGKLSRQSLQREALLRRLGREKLSSSPAVEEESESLQVLRGIWEEVLLWEGVQAEDNFFDLGGHSLLATQVIARASDVLGLPLEVRHLFEKPTLAELATLAESLRPELEELDTLTVASEAENVTDSSTESSLETGDAPLSFAQQSFWFLEQLEPGSEAFIVPVSWRITGILDLSRLEAAFQTLVERQALLRTVLAHTDRGVVQKVLPPSSFSLPVLDLSALSLSQREREVQAQMDAESERRFDLMKGPLFVARLLRCSEDEHVLLVTFHHVIADLRSLEVLLDELKAAYENKPLPALSLQYDEYAREQRREAESSTSLERLERWKQRLQGAPTSLPLWTDKSGEAQASALRGMEPLSLSVEVSERLQQMARDSDATLYMTLLAAFFAFLHRWTGERSLVLGSPVSVREQPELQPLLGFFVNSLVLRSELEESTTFRQLLAQVREVTLDALGEQACPLESLVSALQPERDATQTALFNVMFSLQYSPWASTEIGESRWQPLVLTKKKTTMPFHLFAQIDERIGLTVEYKQDLFEAATIQRLLELLARLWERLLEEPDTPLSKLSWCENDVSWLPCLREESESTETLLQRFESLAAQQPEALALIGDSDVWSYRELNEQANAVAARLQAVGVEAGTEQRVALWTERSLEAVAGYIGIWKAGAVVLPIDGQAPDDWVRFVLEDTEPAAVLRSPGIGEKAVVPCPSVLLSSLERVETWESHRALPSEMAYLLFTSGSTGRPKGVMVEHRQLPRLLDVTQETFDFGVDDCWSLFHSLAFDFSVWEMWGALATGGRLLVVPYLVSRDPELFWRWVVEKEVSILSQTPSAFAGVMEAAERSGQKAESLRWVVFGGEELESSRLRRWPWGIFEPRFANLYGITETTVHVTCLPLEEEHLKEQGISCIGQPLEDLETLICNDAGQPQPVGVPGELFVGGAGVSRGYWRRPGLTDERFCSLAALPGHSLYRTGDRVVQGMDGQLRYLGRLDQQVQLRGFRIEPGEIQAVLESWKEVRQAAVFVDAREQPPVLAGFVRLLDGHLLRRDWRSVLSQRLLPHMLPSRLQVVQEWPLTLQGKLHKARLLEMEQANESADMPAQSPLEAELMEIWCRLLKRDSVGREESFFDVGGHSLIATRLVTELREKYALQLPLRLIFTTDLSVASLAEWICQEQLAQAEDDELLALLDEVEGLSDEEVQALLEE